MAIGASNLTNGATATAATSFVTASVSPGANHLILLTVGSRGAATNNTPTATGAGMTWTLVSSQINALNTNRVTVFRALAGSPGSGTVTIDFAGQSQTACLWSIDDFSGTDTSGTNGAGAIVQTVSALSTGITTGITVTLAALGSANNAAFGGCHRNVNALLTAGTGFTALSPGAKVGGSQETEWNLNTTSVPWTWASATGDVEAMAIEIKAAVAVTANFGWNENDTPVSRRTRRRSLDETAQTLFFPAPTAPTHVLTDVGGIGLTDTGGVLLTDVFTAFGWETVDQPAPRKKRFRPLDEVVNVLTAPAAAVVAPNFGWNTNDTVAPRKRVYRQLDEVVQAPSRLGLPAPPSGWLVVDDTAPRRKKFRGLDETLQPLVPLIRAPPLGWYDWNDTAPRRRRYRQLDETVHVISALGLPVGTQTPSIFWLTDDETAPRRKRFRPLDETVQPLFPPPVVQTVPTDFWQTVDETKPVRRRYRQLDETVQVPSPLGLPAPPFGWALEEAQKARRRFRGLDEVSATLGPVSTATQTPSVFWLTDDDTAPRRRKYRQLDETSHVISSLGLPAIVGTPSIFWMPADDTRPRRRRYVSLDETVITLTLPPGLPVPVPPPPPSGSGSTRIIDLNASFVFGPNTPQLGDLAVAVLQDLGVLEAGQPVASEDAMTIINRLFPKLEELNERDVAFIDADNISNAQFLPLVKIMAYECASAFTITDSTKLSWLESKGGKGGEAEGTLKDIVRLRTPRQTMRVETFTRPKWWH